MHEKQTFTKPASLSHEQAAAIPVNYLTAWQLLVVMGALKPEETVLIHNAGGGVGLAAIDIARHLGATIYGTASGGKHDFLKQRGLHEAIDYRTKDWAVELERLTQGKGVALITDKSAFGVNLGHMWHEPGMIAAWMEILLKGVADGWVRPHVDKSFPLRQAGEAQTYMEQR